MACPATTHTHAASPELLYLVEECVKRMRATEAGMLCDCWSVCLVARDASPAPSYFTTYFTTL
jgi:hypothetical protein